MAVLKDIINGSGLEVTKKKRSKTLIAIVTGITGTTTYDKETDALSASGVPAIGSTLGTMNCVSQTVKIKGPDLAHITLRYETGDGADQADPDNPDLPTYELSTQTQQVLVKFEEDGKTPIKVTYNNKEYVSSYVLDVSLDLLRVSRVETGINPGKVSRKIRNTVNAKAWKDDAAGEWRCVDVHGVSPDAGLTWNMTYEFLHSPTGHQPEALAIDKNTGEMFEGASGVTQNGVRTIEKYKSFDFAKLKL